jgi:hypothetical protein
MIYAQDDVTTRKVVEQAADFHARSDDTHFRSRLNEGRSEETCEWSLAMAMSELGLHVFPWLQGRNSPQLDYIDALVDHDRDFREVTYRFYTSPFVYSLRGIPNESLRNTLLWLAEKFPRMGEYIEFTPYVLHFGWLHQKALFEDFAERTWDRLIDEQTRPRRAEASSAARTAE